MPITSDALIKEPWAGTCAMLVMPEGVDGNYPHVLEGKGDRLISQYVQAGGKYLGFGEGGGYGSGIRAFESGMVLGLPGAREPTFFPGAYCRKSAGEGFTLGLGEPRAIGLKVEGTGETFRSFYAGSGVFERADSYSDEVVRVLARFTEDIGLSGEPGNAAVVYCKVGEGGAILASPRLEFASAKTKDASASSTQITDALLEDDEKRVNFLGACLKHLSLVVGPNENTNLTLSFIHISSLLPPSAKELADSWREIITVKDGDDYILGENDTFCLKDASPAKLRESGIGVPDSSKAVKYILVHGKNLPASEETPFFNHSAFYASLSDYQALAKPSVERFGRFLLYGEVLTSTNTLLARNHELLHRLPTGFTALATLQTAGRGRGSNVWLSPLGCLLFSTCVRHPMSLCQQAPPAFVQYLVAMAIVEGVKSYDVGYKDIPVRLKWPNDIYVEEPDKLGQDSYVKVGGILVQCSGDGKEYFLVVALGRKTAKLNSIYRQGVGLNTKNSAPTTSLDRLLDAVNLQRAASGRQRLPPFTQEKLLARILVTFEELYVRFCESGWSTFFEDMYHKHWLHSNQIVTLETLPSAPQAIIQGITRDFALLRVEELDSEGNPTGRTHELQPDGNSFDFFRGLVKTKG